MTRPPRRLSREEAELWSRVARTVKPLTPPRPLTGSGAAGEPPQAGGGESPPGAPSRAKHQADSPLHRPAGGPPPLLSLSKGGEEPRPLDRHGLDASWDKRLARGLVQPDFTLDLHGYGLDAAYVRLEQGLTQAAAMRARAVLVITGRPRPADPAGRGERRGAIRAKLLDWLAAGTHAGRIAAVRPAHRRHGGAGAVYIILRR